MDVITPADFHDIVTAEDPVLDPTASKVAFVRREPKDDEEYEATIHEVSIADGQVRRLTVSKGTDSQPRYHPDGTHLAFVSDRLTDDQRPQLWLLPLDGGEAEQVTSVCGGISSIEWSPGGERILFTQQVSKEDRDDDRDLEVDEEFEPEEPDPRVIDRTIYRAHEHYFDQRRALVYLLDIEERSVERVTAWDDLDHQEPCWGDETTIYFHRKAGEDPDDSYENELVEVDLETDETRVITTIEGYIGGLDTDRNGHLIFAHSPTPRPTLQQAQVSLVDVSTGELRSLTDPLDRSVYGQVRFNPDGESVYFGTADTGGIVLRRTDLDGQEHEVLTDPDAAVGAFDVGDDQLVFVQSEWDHPGDLFAHSLGDETTHRLTELNDAFLEERIVQEPEELWFEGEDGHRIQGWVLTPPKTAGGEPPYPLVLEIHGGPHAMWTTSGTMWHEFQSLAGAGYAVLWTNPRGSVGYGREFAAAIKEDWGDVTHTDLMRALDVVADREQVDETQLFVTGGSFGGYQTAWTIGKTDRFVAAVSQRGVYDMPAFFGTSDAYRLIESEFDAVPWEAQAYLYDRSPTSLVTEVDTPTLLIHSEDDFRTPIATAEMYFNALRKLEVPTRLVRYPREGHELSRSGEPMHRVDRIERIIRWFDGYAVHTDVPPALERPLHEGLSLEETDDESDE